MVFILHSTRFGVGIPLSSQIRGFHPRLIIFRPPVVLKELQGQRVLKSWYYEVLGVASPNISYGAEHRNISTIWETTVKPAVGEIFNEIKVRCSRWTAYFSPRHRLGNLSSKDKAPCKGSLCSLLVSFNHNVLSRRFWAHSSLYQSIPGRCPGLN